jgi:predicted ATP-dependent protease
MEVVMKDKIDSINVAMQKKCETIKEIGRCLGEEVEMECPQISFPVESSIPAIKEINKTKIIKQSKNGSRFIKTISGIFKRRK